MKILVTLFASLMLLVSTGVQSEGKIKRLIRMHKDDAALVQKIKEFEKGGVQKHIDLSGKSKNRYIRKAKKYMGVPYKWGGCSKKCVDCSGFTYLAFKDIGVDFPRGAIEQARYGRMIIKKEKLKKGDLIFFTKTYASKSLITHVGIYLGKGEFIHASSSKGVSIADINDPYYWHDKFIFGTRVFGY